MEYAEGKLISEVSDVVKTIVTSIEAFEWDFDLYPMNYLKHNNSDLRLCLLKCCDSNGNTIWKVVDKWLSMEEQTLLSYAVNWLEKQYQEDYNQIERQKFIDILCKGEVK